MIDTTPLRLFTPGENKLIRFKVASHKKQAVVVIDAVYTLYDGNQIVSTGKCAVNKDEVSFYLTAPNEPGTYTLETLFSIPPETRKMRVLVRVN